MYPDKFQLTQEENIFLAKKTLVNNIYSQARMENINVTFPDTQTLIQGMSVGGLKIDDVQKILNLRNAWQYVLKNIHIPFTLSFISEVHKIVAYGELPSHYLGTIRNGEVGIGGSFYVPKIYTEDQINEIIHKSLNNNKSSTEKALDYFLNACRSQFFWDGNKRTASICTNRLLIEKGAGVFIIPDSRLRKFNQLMIEFYESADKKPIKNFLYTYCIVGLSM